MRPGPEAAPAARTAPADDGAYVVAADGGNSKTELVLATLDGNVLTRLLLAGTRPHLDGGVDAMATVLADAVIQARAAIGLGGLGPVQGVFCLANVDLPEDEAETEDALIARGVAGALIVQNDTFAVLNGGTDRGWGIAVVAGAGINALGVHPDGRVHRFLALGEYTGDWGGGYSLGIGALGAAIRASDGRGAPTVLSELVPRVFRRPDARSVAIAVHRRGTHRERPARCGARSAGRGLGGRPRGDRTRPAPG